MKRAISGYRAVFIRSAVLAAAFLASCASAPPEPAETGPVPVPEKVRKERIETTRIPVLVKETSYFGDGILDKTSLWTYNDDKTLVLRKTVTRPSIPDPVERHSWEYEGTNVSALSIFDSDGAIRSKTAYGYDASSRLATETMTDSKGLVQSVSKYEYDAAGHKAAWRVYDASGSLLALTAYAYADGAVALITLRNGAERILGTIEQTNDASGEAIKKVYKDTRGAVESVESFMRKDGFLAEERRERGDGRLERRTVYEAGEGGVPVKASISDGSGRVREILVREYAWRTENRTIVYYE